MKSATSSPNARPWTLGKGRPIGTAEVPPIRSARPWVDVVSHGIIWVSIVFRNKTVDFELTVVCQFRFSQLLARQSPCQGQFPIRDQRLPVFLERDRSRRAR